MNNRHVVLLLMQAGDVDVVTDAETRCVIAYSIIEVHYATQKYGQLTYIHIIYLKQ